MGDINADILNPLAHPGKSLLNSLALAGTRPTTTSPTRVTQTSATCIDVIAVNEDIQLVKSEVNITAASDHYQVTAIIRFSHAAVSYTHLTLPTKRIV